MTGTKTPLDAVKKYYELCSYSIASSTYKCVIINPNGEELDTVYCGYSSLFKEFRHRLKMDFLEE